MDTRILGRREDERFSREALKAMDLDHVTHSTVKVWIISAFERGVIALDEQQITYRNAPLVEVALSVQFDAIHDLSSAHLGAFWWSRRSSFPHVKTVPPIASTSDDFNAARQWMPPTLQLALTNQPDCRLQMISEDSQWVLQIQLDRLVINWRKRAAVYPRFSVTKERLAEAWDDWLSFIAESKLPRPVPIAWDVTYVNQIQAGEMWMTPKDWPSIFPGLWSTIPSIENTEINGLKGQWIWTFSSPRHRLIVEPVPHSTNEGVEALLVNMIARGPVLNTLGPSPAPSFLEGLETGHRSVVQAFEAISSPKAKSIWRREYAN